MTDSVFAALADPHRREILSRLAHFGPQPTASLTSLPGMTRQGASRHLALLESSGLVVSRRSGRVVVRELNLKPLRGTSAWIEELSTEWDKRLARLAAQYETPALGSE